MSGHTPGPWSVLNKKTDDHMGRELDTWAITANSGVLWICIDSAWDPEHDVESFANARLIASAPELLEALKAMVEAGEFEDWDGRCVAQDNARRVIAKAEGLQQDEP